MKTDASQGIILNIIIGVIGAFIGGVAVNVFEGTGLLASIFTVSWLSS